MFEIDGAHIALLDEESLRELVGLLCEAELETSDLPRSAVTRGGHQNAADGGLDVRVRLSVENKAADFIPRTNTGFQVKKMDMPAGAIKSEMRPEPAYAIRPVISDLASKGGAYIIVSSEGSVADFALTNRLTAMAGALSDTPSGHLLKVDFYDRIRLATWVRKYPGLIPWVRSKTNTPLTGWQSFDAWAGDKTVDLEYLQEEKLRIRTPSHQDGEGLSPADGIDKIRAALRIPGKVVRLVGLSGVGKTRLAQALFDSRVGQNSLSEFAVAYTNMADSPDPTPLELIENLSKAKKRFVIVVDNCPPDLHRRITECCSRYNSSVSVLTIEYDVREDEPERTEVFHLDPASDELVEKLIRYRRPDISEVDARTIAQFSGGNARIAFALVSTVATNGNITGLKDEELFQRLFKQRHKDDADLLSVAEACSLVYSFDGEDLSPDSSELAVLGRLIGKTPLDIYRGTAELANRDLLQARSKWRAVLPHAIANRLAQNALMKIPPSLVNSELIQNGSERQRRSLSRRLGYLVGSKEAQKLASSWLKEGSLLGDIQKLSDAQLSMIENIAPVASREVLDAITRAVQQGHAESASKLERLSDTIRGLAYKSETFSESVEILVKILELSDSDRVEGKIISLFPLYLSGTQAPIDLRLKVINVLTHSGQPRRVSLGIKAMKATLEATHFYADSSFEFGGMSRDYGWWPKTLADVRSWFAATINAAKQLATQETSLGEAAALVLADKLRGLWTSARMYDEVTAACLEISKARYWSRGWIALRDTIRFDSQAMTTEVLKRLVDLQKSLAPVDLENKIRTVVFDKNLDFLDGDSIDDVNDAYERTEALARELGIEVATNQSVLEAIFPDLFKSGGRLQSFSAGLALGAAEPETTWRSLIDQLATTPENGRVIGVIVGFLTGLKDRDPSLLHKLLDEALIDERTAKEFPTFQAAVGVDAKGVARLKIAVALKKAPIVAFNVLSFGKATQNLSATDLSDLLRLIDNEPNGNDVAINILALHVFATKKLEQPDTIAELGRHLLSTFSFQVTGQMRDHRASLVASTCLRGSEGKAIAKGLLDRLILENSTSSARSTNYHDLVVAISKIHPHIALDAFLVTGSAATAPGLRALREIVRGRDHPFAAMAASELLAWCQISPKERFALAAGMIPTDAEIAGKIDWTEAGALLLKHAPDRCAVLGAMAAKLHPSGGWSGSLVPRFERFRELISHIDHGGDQALIDCIAHWQSEIEQAVTRQKEYERQSQRVRDETFE